MKKYLFVFFSLLLFSINTHASENPYKFLKKEVLIGKAKSEMKNDTRSISKKKALSIFEDPDGKACLLYTSPSPRDRTRSRMPSSA